MSQKSPRRAKRLVTGIVIVLVLGVAGFLILTSPWTWSLTHPARDVADDSAPDLANGKTIFIASDCGTCHATPGQADETHLGGGRVLNTAFGTFHISNISPDPEDGIGSWTLAEFTRAMREGVGPGGLLPDGRNLYPAFPYTSYQRLTANDVRDLFAYIKTLPPVSGKTPDHELKFPYNLRRGVGVWRLAFLDGKPVADTPPDLDRARATTGGENLTAADLEHGRYLVEAAGHCVECHSPRTFMGNIPAGLQYAGGPSADGENYVPNITPDETGIGYWSVNEIANYLKTGLSPINQAAMGEMAEVVRNTAQLTDQDRRDIAGYLRTIPPVHHLAPGHPEPNYTTRVVMLETSHQARAQLPTSSESRIAGAQTVYVAATKDFFLSPDAMDGKADPDGKLLGAARLKVLETRGDRIRVELAGWQLQGAEAAFYQEQGHRILQALLGDQAIGAVRHDQPFTDPETGQVWYPATLTLWTDAADLNTELGNLWNYSSAMFGNSCATCHVKPEPGNFSANQWIGSMKSMKRNISLTDDQYRLLLAYLQNHSKDVGPEAN